jgi:hypothetical protein
MNLHFLSHKMIDEIKDDLVKQHIIYLQENETDRITRIESQTRRRLNQDPYLILGKKRYMARNLE